MIRHGWLLAVLCGALLGGCSPQPIRPAQVYEHVAEQVKQAAAERRPDTSAEKALLPPLTVEMPKNVDLEPRFDLAVVNANAVQVFMALVSGTRYNMLVGPEVAGQISVNLKNVTVREALESIRELYGYEFTFKGNRISIQPNALQTRVFQINYLASRRQGSSELRVTSSSISGGGAPTGSGGAVPASAQNTPVPAGTGQQSGAGNNITARVQTSTDSDFWSSMTTALAAIVGTADGRNVVVNSQSGVIVIRALPREIRAVETYLKATQTIVERQVMLEAKIIEVALKQEYQSGINWGSFNGREHRFSAGVLQPNAVVRPPNVPISGGPTSVADTPSYNEINTGTLSAAPGVGGMLASSALGKGFFGLAFQTANFAALLNFLETQGAVSVLSSPRIATLNNQKAVLKVGTDELFVTNVTTTTTSTTAGSVSTPSLTLQPYFSGISLDVTPQIDDDSNIILHVHPAISSVSEKEKLIDLGGLGQYKLPLASSSVNETDSIVRVQDANIVAIGGLMTQEQRSERSGLPGTNGMTAGPLLNQRGSSLSKREIVILIKPTVIRDDRAWVKDLTETGERLRSLDPRPVESQQ